MKIKSFLILTGVYILFSPVLSAQKFELTPFAGYETGAKIKAISGGEFHIDGGFLYGGSFSVGFGSYRFELLYNRMASNLTYTINNSTQQVCDLAVNQFSLGAVWEYNPEDKLVPLVKFALGSVIYDPTDTETASEKLMHFTFAGGLKYNLSDHLGLKFESSLLLPLFFEGLYFSEGPNGEQPEVGTQVAGVMGEFTGGIVVRF